MSGWISSDSRQYRFLISPDVADGSTPKTSYASASCPAGRLLSSLQYWNSHLPCALTAVPPYTTDWRWRVQISGTHHCCLLTHSQQLTCLTPSSLTVRCTILHLQQRVHKLAASHDAKAVAAKQALQCMQHCILLHLMTRATSATRSSPPTPSSSSAI